MTGSNGVEKVEVQIIERRLSELNPAPYNPRDIDGQALAGLGRSVEKFGCVELIIVNVRDGRDVIVSGHQRYKVLKERGDAKVTCVAVDISVEDEKLLNITMNNPAIQGQFTEQLTAAIDELREGMTDQKDYIGLRIDELRAQIESEHGESEKAGAIDADEVGDLPAEPKSKEGDFWQLGDHRLICGNCTDAKVMERLLGVKRASLIFADPPYNMNYKSKPLGGIKNDHMKESKFVRFILESTQMMTGFLREGGSYYICMSAAEYPLVYHQLRKLGLKGRQVIWVKPSVGLGAQEYRPQYEVMFYGYTGKRSERCFNSGRVESDLWDFAADRGVIARSEGEGMVIEFGLGVHTTQIVLDKKTAGTVMQFDGSADDLWRIGRAGGLYKHPTQKPVDLVARAIHNSSNVADVVLDPFCGSGTTIIAAEKTSRKCYAVELDPAYCDVIIERWEQWSCGKAELIRD